MSAYQLACYFCLETCPPQQKVTLVWYPLSVLHPDPTWGHSLENPERCLAPPCVPLLCTIAGSEQT